MCIAGAPRMDRQSPIMDRLLSGVFPEPIPLSDEQTDESWMGS
jgi:hypothetical protein